MKKVIFDLDGTLINSQEGVTKSVQHALRSIGIDEPDLDSLRCFIGPPLSRMFKEKYNFSDEVIGSLIPIYRQRYETVGVHECELYPGVEEVLKSLHDKGYILTLGSSKPEVFCTDILQYFHIDQYFTHIVGATLGPERQTKIQVLEEAFCRMNVKDKSEVILIGDTKYDVEGANAAGIDCVGITYGFGTREELLEHGAIAVFDTLTQVEEYLDGTA
ncbi:MAG: HAD hydrolase-like protein [bacterium]|nr:HAD hydrolase-like protein [bacterium]